LPLLQPIREDVTIKHTPAAGDLAKRPAVQVSLGCHVERILQVHPDPTDPDTIEAGARKRFVSTPPTPDPERLSRLTEFVRQWCRENLVPLSPDVDTSVEAWLPKTNYPLGRQQELQTLWDEREQTLTRKDFNVKSFVKDETYPEYKHARIINSRTDMFKCAVGPIFRLIEEQVFKNDAFIKKVPIHLRPKFIRERLVLLGAKYFWADFTSFESHFTPEIMEAIEFVMYDHMTQHLPGHDFFMHLCRDVIAGRNHCILRYLTVDCPGRRMSGEMNTSLGNGFTNLMLLLFLFKELGEEVSPVVEGDDSNTSFMQRCPTAQDFASLGFTIKCGVEDNFEEMSFCGMIFDPDDLVNITDPCKVLATFGWARAAYTRYSDRKLRVLLRCKALSYLHQFRGAPIIQSMALYVLRMTRSVDVTHFVKSDVNLGMWERNEFLQAIEFAKLPLIEVPDNTRKLCERMFGISPDQQREVERYFEALTELQPLAGPVLSLPFAPVLSDYFDRYVISRARLDRDLDFPSEFWPRLNGFVPEFD